MKPKTFAVDIDGTITENGGGRINLDALSALRHMNNIGHNVIFVTGRSSVEAYLLSVFSGTTKIAVGENGGCITLDTNDHVLLGDIMQCREAFEIIKKDIDNVVEKPVFPRMTEVVLERTFDLELAKQLVQEKNLDVLLSDSQ
ncbi:MAG: HAD hydrolase family protein, partial [Nitrosarchaeum sp.]